VQREHAFYFSVCFYEAQVQPAEIKNERQGVNLGKKNILLVRLKQKIEDEGRGQNVNRDQGGRSPEKKPGFPYNLFFDGRVADVLVGKLRHAQGGDEAGNEFDVFRDFFDECVGRELGRSQIMKDQNVVQRRGYDVYYFQKIEFFSVIHGFLFRIFIGRKFFHHITEQRKPDDGVDDEVREQNDKDVF
jgi:hypothetical protein